MPPSEGKSAPITGAPLDLSQLSFPELATPRRQVVRELVKLSRGGQTRALRVLGLSPGQVVELAANAEIEMAPAAPAREIYSGVLYAALGLNALGTNDLNRASERILITSSLFGLLRPNDEIPTYRLTGSASLPRIGKVSAHWRKALGREPLDVLDTDLIVDFRSGTYVSFWPIPKGREDSALTVKIWQQGADGAKTAVSHHNKATKGELAGTLATAPEVPQSPSEVAEYCQGLGWDVSLEHDAKLGHARLDVLI
ncbi:MAG: peroxide stress protein YaaA [Actinobacteria bacterium]|nr:peroxide stress protein YaaA [Actinomycetota bacterium]